MSKALPRQSIDPFSYHQIISSLIVANLKLGRRRKIKCIYQTERNGSCNECFARGVSCVDQESAAEAQTLETRQSLRERVANLESLIKAIAHKVDVEDITPPVKTITKQVIVTTTSDLALSEAGYDRAPIMSLFNNSITTFATVPQSDLQSIHPEAKSTEGKIRQRLLAHLPSDEDIEAIWAKCSHWWTIWARMFPELKYASGDGLSYIKTNSKSDSVLSLSKAILCLCLGLQQVDVVFVRSKLNLPLPRDDLIQYYVSTVHETVCSEDRYLTKTEGLEIAILLAKIDANAGRPRKAWLTYRRAISFALLLGFNRKNTWQVTSADPTLGPKRRAIFWALFSGDRYLSLILGLPYSLSDQQCDIASMTEAMDLSTISSKAMYDLSKLGGRLIERYQNPELVSLATTMSYDRQLQGLRKGLPTIEQLNPNNPETSFEGIYDGSIALIYYNYVRTLLHLPFVLKFSDASFEYSRKTSLESAREMIQAYTYLRQGAHGAYLNCRILDFQIFLICLVLIINAMAFEPFAPSRSASDTATIGKDWNRVEAVKKLLVTTEMGSTGQPTVQDSAIKTLNKLLECRHGCPHDATGSTDISIPYFGTITVSPREEIIATYGKSRHQQHQQLPTPAQTLSSCGSPGSQTSRPVPTPPISIDMNDTTKLNPYFAFDRENIPMPPAYCMNAIEGNSGEFAFNNSIYMNDMVGSYDWLSMPVTFDTETGNGWLGNQQLDGQNPEQHQHQNQGGSMF